MSPKCFSVVQCQRFLRVLMVLLCNYTHFLMMKVCSSGVAVGGGCHHCNQVPWVTPRLCCTSPSRGAVLSANTALPAPTGRVTPAFPPSSFMLLLQTGFAQALGCSWPAGGAMLTSCLLPRGHLSQRSSVWLL